MSAPTTVEVRDAATLMLVRDGDAGLEVCMLRRRLTSAFVAGAHVFPGGAVDEADREPAVAAVCAGRTDADASTVLGLPHGGLGYWVAAVRESFEEAGVLLAAGEDGRPVRFDDPEVAIRFEAYRLAVDGGASSLTDVSATESLVLRVDDMHYFSHWITPEGAPRRYDTRFFVALAPEGQEPRHDRTETIAEEWVRPTDGIDRHRAGRFELIEPTLRSLQTLADFDSADAVVHATATEPVGLAG